MGHAAVEHQQSTEQHTPPTRMERRVDLRAQVEAAEASFFSGLEETTDLAVAQQDPEAIAALRQIEQAAQTARVEALGKTRPRELPRLEQSPADDVARLKDLLASERGSRFGVPLAKDLASRLATSFDATSFRAFQETLRNHPGASAAAEQVLRNKIGPKYARELLTNEAFLEKVELVKKAMATRVGGEKGPKIYADPNGEPSLETVVAFTEYFGDQLEAVANGMNLTQYAEEMKATQNVGTSLFNMDKVVFDKEGNLSEAVFSASIEFEYRKQGSVQVGEMQRVYQLLKQEGKPPRKELEFVTFRLPYDLEQKGIAAKSFMETLPAHLQMEIKSVTFEADINVGRYAWAMYGARFNTRNMNRENIRAVVGSAAKNYETMRDKYRARKKQEKGVMGRFVGLFKKRTEDPAEAAFAEADALFKELQGRDPYTVTTQELANLMRKGPKFIHGSDDQWYREEEFEDATKRAAAKGNILSESEQFPKSMPIGKLALIVGEGTSWHGEMAFDDETTMQHLFKAIQGKI